MKSKIRKLLPALALLLLCGCLDYNDKLTINPDGSGAVHIEVRTTLPLEFAQMMGMSGGLPGQSTPFPPLSKRAAQKTFPAKDFTLSFSNKSGEEGETNHVVIDAAFKNIDALLNSRYAEARGLTLKVEGDKLILRAKSGLESMVGAAATDQAEMMQESLSAFPGQ